jgi:hypothetical protein
VPEGLAAGRYFLRARVSTAAGQELSTNAYELVVPDTSFGWLDSLSNADIAALVDGAPATEGFHYWHGGAVALRARPGLRGLVAGWSQAESRGIDLHETVQGEHLFRHLLPELAGLAGADRIVDDLWTIRSEVVSPEVKTRTLLRYAELFVRRAEEVAAVPRRRRSKQAPPAPAAERPPASQTLRAVGRDVVAVRPGRALRAKP